MFRIKIIFSIIIFSFLLVGTSIVKNQTREIEKKIYNLSKEIQKMEKDLNESQLDYEYLTSPLIIEQRIELLNNQKYFPMEYSKIFLSISNFLNLKNKLAIQDNYHEKKDQKK
tara:strand:+ start:188 stop:526 length:339 start_codon:yes stop_codon:yes gene_type:complete